MGAVYQAWDQVLEVAVAVKVIRVDASVDPEIAAELERRFKRELLLARQVTHRNVVRIHDLGEIDGIKYITMPYIQGSDLSSVLKKDGRLPVVRALGIARQVAAGLVAAHEAGVVHRDLKPANIMLDAEDHACVMDFGIARSTSGATAFAMTVAGAVVGTVEYMAPEQAKGESVDQRADVYALGLIVRDMLLGPRHHGAGTAMSELMSRMEKAPAPLRTMDPQIPPALDELVSRCLQPDPAARYETSQALQLDLERLTPEGHAPVADLPRVPAPRPLRTRVLVAAAIVLAAGLVAGGTWVWRNQSARSEARAVPERPVSIAVLPFHNATLDASLDSLGPSLAEVLRSELGQTAYLRTVPSERLSQVLSDLKVESADLDKTMLDRVADLINADVILRGTYTKLGNQIVLTASLHDIGRNTQEPLTAQAPDEQALLAAVDTLVRATREKIVSPEAAQTLASAPHKPMSRSFEAVRAYSDGLTLARQGKHEEAIARFKSATESDTGFALAHARMALSYSARGYDAEAQRASTRAVELSEGTSPSDRFFILASDASIRDDSGKAIEYYRQLVDAAPSDILMRFELATLLERTGDLEGAREQLQKVLVGDPKFVNALVAAGRVEIRRGSPQTSLDALNSALTLAIQLGNDHARGDVLQAIGVAYKRLDKPNDALAHFRQAHDIRRRLGQQGGVAASLSEIAQMQARLGQGSEALKSFKEAEQLRRQIGDRNGLANTLIDLGTFLLEQARYEDALVAYKESLQIQRELGNETAEATALNNIGGVYFEQGNYEDALTYFDRALAMREKRANQSDVSQTLHNMGETHLRLGQFDRALDNYLRALDLSRKAGDMRSEAIEAYSVGTVFEYQGRYGAALKSREEAYQQFQKLDDRSFWHAEILAGYGRSLMLVGKLDEAGKSLEEAIRVARDQGNQAVLARALNDEGERLRLKGDLTGARKPLEEAAKIARELGDRFLDVRTQVNQALLSTKDPQRAASVATTLDTLSRTADSQGLKYLAIESTLGRVEALLTAGQAASAGTEVQRALTRAENFGMRMLQARAHYLAARAAHSTGEALVARRHAGEALRLLEAAKKEEKASEIGRRGAVAEMLGEAAKLAR
jgi:tetratricopeptide (TPR) repeat protein/tRNA A-37 threonylcarbamoyl transferase component Bud32